MHRGFNIIATVPAGRERYLKLLMPHILSAKGVIDELHLWVNTDDRDDLKHLDELAASDGDFIKLKEVECEPPRYGKISRFFDYCVEPNTIYVRLDDDIVWMEPDFFRKFLDYRIDNPDFFIIGANVINNWGTHYINSKNGLEIHQRFIDDVKSGKIDEWRDRNRFKGPGTSIKTFAVNCISWFGEMFRDLNVKVLEPEEPWLNTKGPEGLKLKNDIAETAICVHIAFKHQRQRFAKDEQKFLDEYKTLRVP